MDIRSLITLEEVMEEFKLGPNGSMIYCLEFLRGNTGWLQSQIIEAKKNGCKYFIFDLPG